MPSALPIRADLSPVALRRLARRERDGRVSARLLALAHALEGMPREEAARLAGMTGQTLGDWVHRYNARGPGGLADRSPLPFRPPLRLERGSASHPQGPGSQRRQTRAGRVRRLARPRLARPGRAPLLGVVYSETGMLRLLHSLDLSWQKARPVHPEADLKAQARFKKACLR